MPDQVRQPAGRLELAGACCAAAGRWQRSVKRQRAVPDAEWAVQEAQLAQAQAASAEQQAASSTRVQHLSQQLQEGQASVQQLQSALHAAGAPTADLFHGHAVTPCRSMACESSDALQHTFLKGGGGSWPVLDQRPSTCLSDPDSGAAEGREQELQGDQASLREGASRAKQEASAACRMEAEAQTALRQAGQTPYLAGSLLAYRMLRARSAPLACQVA